MNRVGKFSLCFVVSKGKSPLWLRLAHGTKGNSPSPVGFVLTWVFRGREPGRGEEKVVLDQRSMLFNLKGFVHFLGLTPLPCLARGAP